MSKTPKNFDGKTTKPPETLTVTECHQLLSALQPIECTHKQRLKSIRNYTIALLMLDAGLRVGEVVQLLQTDLIIADEPVHTLCLSPQITKTKTGRLIPLSSRIKEAIGEMHKNVWSDNPDLPAYQAFCRTGSILPLTTRQVERIIRAAALTSIHRPIHPHVLRHTFASKLMRKASMRVVQELLGHASITSTQIYTHPNNEDLKDAIEQIDCE